MTTLPDRQTEPPPGETRCMDAESADLVRIRTMTPPDYDVFRDCDYSPPPWVAVGPDESELRRDFRDEAEAIAACWAHYDRVCAPAVSAALDQRMREVAEWLRDLADALQLETSVATRDSAQIVEAKAAASLLREIAAALASRFGEGSK